ncbi:MAG: hypothetical protein HKN82_15195 [Akkermansiaceae bacterium]|nr:hypothetical protein [Akkermansiaceae bacterium]
MQITPGTLIHMDEGVYFVLFLILIVIPAVLYLAGPVVVEMISGAVSSFFKRMTDRDIHDINYLIITEKPISAEEFLEYAISSTKRVRGHLLENVSRLNIPAPEREEIVERLQKERSRINSKRAKAARAALDAIGPGRESIHAG